MPKKALSSHIWDKSAETSAIPPKLTFTRCEISTRLRTIIRIPMDNGWESRQPLLNNLFKAALQSPFTDCFTLPSHRRELSVDSLLSATTLLHRFFLSLILPLYARMFFLSTVFKIFYRVLSISPHIIRKAPTPCRSLVHTGRLQ